MPEQRLHAPTHRAVHDFTAHDTWQLSLSTGTLVEVVKEDEDGWCEVRCNAEGRVSRGFVPLSYLEPCDSAVQHTTEDDDRKVAACDDLEHATSQLPNPFPAPAPNPFEGVSPNPDPFDAVQRKLSQANTPASPFPLPPGPSPAAPVPVAGLGQTAPVTVAVAVADDAVAECTLDDEENDPNSC